MPYSADVVKMARERLAQQKADRESQYRQNLYEAYTKLPRLQEIDIALRSSMAQAARTAFVSGADGKAALEKVRRENLTLQQEYKTLVEANFAPDFLDESPICPHCGGKGYVGATMCRCLAELCLEEQRRELAELTTGKERFSGFRLDYYPDQLDPNYGASPRFIMERTLSYCKQYAAKHVEACFALAGAVVKHNSQYPGWKPKLDSPILEVSKAAYKKLFNTEPVVRAIHAGLECGLFLDIYPDLDMISFGPTLRGVHAPGERLELASLDKFRKLLEEIIVNLK